MDEVKAFTGTMKVRQAVLNFEINDEKTLQMKYLSCFKCIINACNNCTHFSLGNLTYQNSNNLPGPSSCVVNSLECGIQQNLNISENTVTWNSIKQDAFILVSFQNESGRKGPKMPTEFTYVCTVISKDEDDGEVLVQGLRLFNDEGTEFIVQDDNDVSYVSLDSIKQILPQPQIMFKNRRIFYKFPVTVDVFEKP